VALMVALALRAGVPLLAWLCGTAPGFFSEPDTRAYVLTSEGLLESGQFARAGEPEIFRTPGYPLFLTPGVAIGQVACYAIALQIVLSLGTVVLVQRLAWLVFQRRDVATAAAWLAACEPISVLYASKLLTETLFTFLFVFGVYRAAKYARTDRLRDLLVAGLLFAMATYMRPAGYYFAPLLAVLLVARLVWCGERRGTRALHVLAFALLVVGAILPWQVRNYRLTGYAGFSSWPANALTYFSTIVRERLPGESLITAMQRATFLDDVEYRDAHPEQQDWSPAERMHWQEERAWPILRAAPGTTAVVYAQGIAATTLDNGMTIVQGLLGDWIPNDDNTETKAGLSQMARVTRAMTVRPQFVLVYAVLSAIALSYIALAGLGMVGGRSVGHLALFLVVVAIAYLLLVSGGPFGSHRMRVPIMPLVSVFAGAGWCRVREILQSWWGHGRRQSPRPG